MVDEATPAVALPPEARIGRVAIRVDDAERVIPFYRDAVGCAVDRDGDTVSLHAGDGRELVRLVEDPNAGPRPRTAAGLFHVAIRLPDRKGLGDALARLRGSSFELAGASDHLVSEALYLTDPAGNGVELYRDRPRDTWTRPREGQVEMDTLPLDVESLAEAGTGAAIERLPDGTDVGHVHLEVSDLDASTAFYRDGLGFALTTDEYPGARFLAAGGYHHHVGLNVWNRRSTPVGDHEGLDWFEVVLPDAESREAVLAWLTDAGHDRRADRDVPTAIDPDGLGVRLPIAGDDRG